MIWTACGIGRLKCADVDWAFTREQFSKSMEWVDGGYGIGSSARNSGYRIILIGHLRLGTATFRGHRREQAKRSLTVIPIYISRIMVSWHTHERTILETFLLPDKTAERDLQ
jgi:hypothetical protein